jgi:predicted Zn-dependent peptidase
MERLIAEPVGDEELGVVKNYMEAALLRKLDGSVDYMRQYMLWHSSGLDESEFETMKRVIQVVDAKQVQTMAQRYMNPDDFVNIVVG